MKMSTALSLSFYSRDTLEVARDLLGKYLVFQPTFRERLVGLIVETEAYRGIEDKACHASWRRRESCEVLWGPPGRAYVYFTYGMYNMLNIVTEKDDFPAAVLIRALTPVEGVGYMESNRKVSSSSLRSASRRRSNGQKESPCQGDSFCYFCYLTSGPGKLTQAFGITYKKHNGVDVSRGDILWVEDRGDKGKPSEVVVRPRIGVAYAGEWAKKPWRFYLKDNPFVSRR